MDKEFLSVEQLDFLKDYLEKMKEFSIETYNHIINVSEIALVMAKESNLSEYDTQVLYYGALLHDIGKLEVPSEILHKPKLTDEEMNYVRQHSKYGYNSLKNLFSDEIINLVLNHHEKPNGKGYPRGLTDSELTKLDKILAVCDVTSALKLPRCYKEGMPTEKIVAILSDCAEKGDLDAKCVNMVCKSYLKVKSNAKEKSKLN